MDQNLFKILAIGVTLWLGGCVSTPSNHLSGRVGSTIEATEQRAHAPNGVKAFCMAHRDQCGETSEPTPYTLSAALDDDGFSTGGTRNQISVDAKNTFQVMMQERLAHLKIKDEVSETKMSAPLTVLASLKQEEIKVPMQSQQKMDALESANLFQSMMRQRLEELQIQNDLAATDKQETIQVSASRIPKLDTLLKDEGKTLKQDPHQIFQYLMKQRVNALEYKDVSAREELTESLSKALFKINAKINSRIWPSEDNVTYGFDDRWAMPLTFPGQDVGARGDCEDYVLEKRRELELLGIGRHSLPIAVVKNPRVGVHAVLLVRTSSGDIVLDNLNAKPQFVDETDYEFIALQTATNLYDWSVAKKVQPTSPLQKEAQT